MTTAPSSVRRSLDRAWGLKVWRQSLVLLAAVTLADVGGHSMTSGAVLRWGRALTLPSVLLISGLVGHAGAGGVTPAASVLVPVFVFTVVAVAQFAGAPISPAKAAGLLVGGQGLLHVAFQLLGGTAVTARTSMCGAATGLPAASWPPHSHLMHRCAGVSHGFAASLMTGERLLMLLGHLAAAVVVGVWLAAGERALLTLLAVTAQSVVAAWRAIKEATRGGVGATAVMSCPRLQPAVRCAVRMSMWDRGVVWRRGPPGSRSPESCAYAV